MSEPMTDEQLAAIEVRASAATAGPWETTEDDGAEAVPETRRRMTRCLVTGSRAWTDVATIRRELRLVTPRPTAIVRLDIEGASAIAGRLARLASVDDVPWPADEAGAMLAGAKASLALAFGPLWVRESVADARPTSRGVEARGRRSQWSHTEAGAVVAACIRARLPVRWVEVPGGEARALTAMPWPPG